MTEEITLATSRSTGARLGYRDGLRELGVHQKTAKGAPAYSRFVNRWLGRHLAALAASWGLTPNQVTTLSAAASLGGIAVVALVSPSWGGSVAAAALLCAGYALDSADGQLARLTRRGSPAGEWLDHVVDSAKIPMVHLAVLVHLYRYLDPPSGLALALPVAFTVVSVVWFSSVLLIDHLRRAASARGGPRMATASTAAPVWRSVLALPTDYGVLCVAFVLLAWQPAFLLVYGLLLLGNLAFLALALPAWYRELASIGTAEA